MKTRPCKFSLRLTEDEMTKLDKKAKKTGMSRSGYVRTILDGYTPITIPPIEYFTLIKEIRILGNDMYKIAYRANSLKLIDADLYKNNADKVLKVCDYLFSLHLPVKVGGINGCNKIMGNSCEI